MKRAVDTRAVQGVLYGVYKALYKIAGASAPAVMRQAAPDAILWAKPNAGLPHLEVGEVVYDATPEFMADVAHQLRQAGAQVIGGCCGTTPTHITAMARRLEQGESSGG